MIGKRIIFSHHTLNNCPVYGKVLEINNDVIWISLDILNDVGTSWSLYEIKYKIIESFEDEIEFKLSI